MKVKRTPKMTGTLRLTITRHIIGDHNLLQHRCENTDLVAGQGSNGTFSIFSECYWLLYGTLQFTGNVAQLVRLASQRKSALQPNSFPCHGK
jgi:hypothetical protein